MWGLRAVRPFPLQYSTGQRTCPVTPCQHFSSTHTARRSPSAAQTHSVSFQAVPHVCVCICMPSVQSQLSSLNIPCRTTCAVQMHHGGWGFPRPPPPPHGMCRRRHRPRIATPTAASTSFPNHILPQPPTTTGATPHHPPPAARTADMTSEPLWTATSSCRCTAQARRTTFGDVR